jgi:hypothetical protein
MRLGSLIGRVVPEEVQRFDPSMGLGDLLFELPSSSSILATR